MTERLPTRFNGGRLRIRVGLIVTILGFLIFLLGADPALFHLDRSPNIGMVQIFVFLCGLALVCIGGYISLASLWNGYQKTIAADIGLRLVCTGYVIAVASGMSDAFGFGSQPPPHIPYFGDWQSTGVLIGEGVIALGFLLLIPFWQGQRKSEE
jgi:hypothetical protein